jgi:hypothetical protein
MTEFVEARTSFTSDGVRVITKGTVIEADDPVVRRHPGAFQPFEPQSTRTTAAMGPTGTAPTSKVPDRPKGNGSVRSWAEYVHSFEPGGATVDELAALGRDALRSAAARHEAALKEG